MARNNVAITYSPYNHKFYQGSHDRDGVDFSRDQNMTPIAKLNPELKMGEGRIEPIHYETFRQAERFESYYSRIEILLTLLVEEKIFLNRTKFRIET